MYKNLKLNFYLELLLIKKKMSINRTLNIIILVNKIMIDEYS